MLHIFEPFRAAWLPDLVKRQRFYLVSQSYHRHQGHLPEAETKPGLLISCYENSSMARTHVKALTNDKYAAVIDLQKPAHHATLQALLAGDSKYQVFIAAVQNNGAVENQLNRLHGEHMKRYIETHTSWRISAGDALRPHLQVIFGELFVTLKFGNKRLRVKLEEIEKLPLIT